jgi:hypothetical protein
VSLERRTLNPLYSTKRLLFRYNRLQVVGYPMCPQSRLEAAICNFFTRTDVPQENSGHLIYVKSIAAALVCAAAFLLIAPASARADGFTDFWVGYRYGTNFREPANPNAIAKNIPQIQYVSGDRMGSNFMNVDILISDGVDQANGPLISGLPCCQNGGAQEIYIVLRHELSLQGLLQNMTDHKFKFKSAVVRDLGLTGGFDFNSKGDQFTSRVRKYFIGPTINFNAPGFASLSVLLKAEQNHNAIVGKYVGFHGNIQLEGSWGFPMHILLPAKIVGFFTYDTPKGPDGFGVQTAPETLVESQLMFDVAGKSKKCWIGVGYQYWHNKFGSVGVGTTAATPQLEMEYHLP